MIPFTFILVSSLNIKCPTFFSLKEVNLYLSTVICPKYHFPFFSYKEKSQCVCFGTYNLMAPFRSIYMPFGTQICLFHVQTFFMYAMFIMKIIFATQYTRCRGCGFFHKQSWVKSFNFFFRLYPKPLFSNTHLWLHKRISKFSFSFVKLRTWVFKN